MPGAVQAVQALTNSLFIRLKNKSSLVNYVLNWFFGELDLVLYHSTDVSQKPVIASVFPLWNYIFETLRSKQFSHCHWEQHSFCVPPSLTGAHTGDFMGSFTYHGQQCYQKLKLERCSQRAKWYLKETKSLGEGVEGKLRPCGGDPACWRHNNGQQRGQEPEPQHPQGQATLPARGQSSARRFCIHTNNLIHALN